MSEEITGGVEGLLNQKREEVKEREGAAQDRKYEENVAVMSEHEENIIKVTELGKEQEKIDTNIKAIKEALKQLPDDQDLLGKLRELEDRKQVIPEEMSRLKGRNNQIEWDMEHDDKGRFRSDVGPDLKIKIATDRTRKIMELGGNFTVGMLGNEEDKQFLRSSTEFVVWAKEKATEVRRVAEAEIKRKKEEILAKFKELGSPRMGVGGGYISDDVEGDRLFSVITSTRNIDGFIDSFKFHKSNDEYVQGYKKLMREIASAVQKDDKRWIKFGASKETQTAQDKLAQQATGLIDTIKRNPRNNDLPERAALGKRTEPVNRENCLKVAEEIIGYFEAEDKKHNDLMRGMGDFKTLVTKNLQAIEWQQRIIKEADGVESELREK